jgi:hypothetical protein
VEPRLRRDATGDSTMGLGAMPPLVITSGVVSSGISSSAGAVSSDITGRVGGPLAE